MAACSTAPHLDGMAQKTWDLRLAGAPLRFLLLLAMMLSLRMDSSDEEFHLSKLQYRRHRRSMNEQEVQTW